MNMRMRMNIEPSIEQRLEFKLELKLELRLDLVLEKVPQRFVYERNDDGTLTLYKMFTPNMQGNEEIYAAVIGEDRLVACILDYYENNRKRAPRNNITVELYEKEPFRRVRRFEIGKSEKK
jgi:hypothetical protein